MLQDEKAAAGDRPLANAQPEKRIRFRGVFASSWVEKEYRRQQGTDERLLARACILVAALGTAVFAFSDHRLFGLGATFVGLLSARLLFLIFSGLTWLGLDRLRSTRSDPLLFAWALTEALLAVAITATRPASYVGHTIVNMAIVLLTYCALPLPLLLQVVPAGILSLGCMILAVHFRIDALTTNAMLTAFAGANILGALVSWRFQRRGRQLYAAACREAELRASLEQALAEIRTLRGILPICAYCKRVRDEKEVWQQIEVYVRDRTHANFSHGICPGCLREQFGETCDR